MEQRPSDPDPSPPVLPPAPLPTPLPAPLPGRPRAITMTGWILIVLGVPVSLAGALVMLSGALFDTIRDTPELRAQLGDLPGSFGSLLLVVGAVLLAYGVAQLVSGINILARREWARIAGLVVAILGAMVTLGSLAPGNVTTAGGTIFLLVLFAAYAEAVYALMTGSAWFNPA